MQKQGEKHGPSRLTNTLTSALGDPEQRKQLSPPPLHLWLAKMWDYKFVWFYAAKCTGMCYDSNRNIIHLWKQSWFDLPLETWPWLARLPKLSWHSTRCPHLPIRWLWEQGSVCLGLDGKWPLFHKHSLVPKLCQSDITEDPLPPHKGEIPSAKAIRLEGVRLKVDSWFCCYTLEWPRMDLLSLESSSVNDDQEDAF